MRDDLRQAALALVRTQTNGNSLSHGTRLSTVPVGHSSNAVLRRSNGANGTVGTVGTVGTSTTKWKLKRGLQLDKASIEERAALVQHDGGVPQHYALAFAEMQQACPHDVPTNRWLQFIHDTGLFLDGWGIQAHALGWRLKDLFDLDTSAPLARFDKMGLCWLLKGQTVFALSAKAARLSGGLTFYRTD
jgi:hypothetical protein